MRKDAYLNHVPSREVTNGPPKTPEYLVDFLGLEGREQSFHDYFDSDWECVGAVKR